MNRFKSHRPLLKAVATLAMAFAATSAVAAPVFNFTATVNAGDFAFHGANTAGTNFALSYAANTPTGATWSDDPTVPSGSVLGVYLSPFHTNTALEGITSYFAVNRFALLSDGTPAAPSPVTLSWANADNQTTFSMLWGSVDSFNTITFKDNVAGVVGSYTGTDLAQLLNSTRGTSINVSDTHYNLVALVTFTFDPGFHFDEIEFRSEDGARVRNAFEFALVPGPAAGLLFLTALGCLGFARRARANA
jgi:hypothetical protein